MKALDFKSSTGRTESEAAEVVAEEEEKAEEEDEEDGAVRAAGRIGSWVSQFHAPSLPLKCKN